MSLCRLEGISSSLFFFIFMLPKVRQWLEKAMYLPLFREDKAFLLSG